jgi:hypothetical protein
MSRPVADVTVTTDGIRLLAAALRDEEDGKALRKELAKNMRDALKPGAERAKSGVMAMNSAGGGTGPGLRSAIAKKIRPEVKLGGRWSGARIKARKTPGIRGFANAPKRTQRPSGWRTQTFGNGVWRTQHGKNKWFDNSLQGLNGPAREAVHEAMEAMARRIAERAG